MSIALDGAARVSARVGPAWFARSLVLIAFAAAVALIEPLALLFRLISRNYNEGWNAYWADAAVHGRDLYASAGGLISNNYPPVSFHIVGSIGQLVGDNVIAGRLVSLMSFVVAVIAAHLWLRAAGTSRRVALAGALFLLTALSWYGNRYVAINDPQMLAHALMLTGLAVLWRFDLAVAAVIGGAVLMLLAGFTKHLLVPLPLAMTAWIALCRRDRLALWLACFAVGLPLGFWLISHAHPGFVHALLSDRVYSARQATEATGDALLRLLPLLLLGTVAVVRALRGRANTSRTPALKFALLYLGFALTVGAFASGGGGVTHNAFFDFVIASCLFAALGLESLLEDSGAQRAGSPSAAYATMAVLSGGMALYAMICLPGTLQSVRHANALERETRATVALIEELGQGRAACETPALCYWAHDQFMLDFFNYGQRVRTGVVSDESCEKLFERAEFPLLQMEVEQTAEGRLGRRCSSAIRRYYTEVFRSAAGTLLVPRQSAHR